MLNPDYANVSLSAITPLIFDMEITQHNLRTLLDETDRAFELAIQYPSSAIHEAKYELAKRALEEHLSSMRQTLQKKVRSR